MRVLVLSDIHANLEALDACLNAAPAYDFIVNLGDIVGYGASPNEVVEKTRNLGKVFVRGNHDKAVSGISDMHDFNPMAAVAALWTRDQLAAENLDWLRSLPQGPLPINQVPQARMSHGSPLDEDEYVQFAREAEIPLHASASQITFFGHTHLQGAFIATDSGVESFVPEYSNIDKSGRKDFSLRDGMHYMINPGSVGQPRDRDWRAAFALLDSDRNVITYCREPYDIKRAQERILAAKLPPRLATRLASGR